MIESRLNNEEKEDVYQNAKLMLEQYRTVIWRLNQDIKDMDAAVEYDLCTDLFSYIDALADIDTNQKSKRLKNRLTSLENSKSLVCMIDYATEILKKYPNKGEIYFNLINDRFLMTQPVRVEEILVNYSISRRTYYRDIHKAIEIIGTILWGFILPYSKRKAAESNLR